MSDWVPHKRDRRQVEAVDWWEGFPPAYTRAQALTEQKISLDIADGIWLYRAMPVKPYRVNLDPDDREHLARLAAARDATVSALIRRAVREFLGRETGRTKKKRRKGG